MHMLVAEQRVLPATEGVIGHRYRDRDVDADHADLDATLKPAGRVAAGGGDGGGGAVGVCVDQLDGLVDRGGPQYRQDGAENFLAVDVHLGADLVENRWANEETLFAAGHPQPTAVHRQPSALLRAGPDQVLDPILGGMADHRSHL